MTAPYLPSGQSQLPANRFVLFAGTDNRVYRVDESLLTKDGASFDAVWESPTLLRAQEIAGRIITISRILLYYMASADTTITVDGSPDGGENWTVSRIVELSKTDGGTRTVSVHLGVTGHDARFRIRLLSDDLVVVHRYRAYLIPRGGLEYV